MDLGIHNKIIEALNMLRKKRIGAFLQANARPATLIKAREDERSFGRSGWVFVRRLESYKLPITFHYGTSKEDGNVSMVGRSIMKVMKKEFINNRVLHNHSTRYIEIR